MDKDTALSQLAEIEAYVKENYPDLTIGHRSPPGAVYELIVGGSWDD